MPPEHVWGILLMAGVLYLDVVGSTVRSLCGRWLRRKPAVRKSYCLAQKTLWGDQPYPYSCTEPEGHRGDHIARIGGTQSGEIAARWENVVAIDSRRPQ